MDLKQLKYFVAVAEERHFTRAAQRLNVVQSGLSKTIRALETELGGPLFIRSTRRVDLTPTGVVLLDQARQVLTAAQDARVAVMQVNGLVRGSLRIGSIQSLAPFVDLPASLGRFHEAFPGIDIELSVDGSCDLLDEVRTARLDIAFTQLAEPLPSGVTTRMLACEGMVVVCPAQHPLAGASTVPLSALLAETFVELKADWGLRRLVDQAFAEKGLQRRIGLEVNHIGMLIALVSQGLGIALVPESLAHAQREDRRAEPIGIATLVAEQEPCWEMVVAFGGADGIPASRVTEAFLELLIQRPAPVGPD